MPISDADLWWRVYVEPAAAARREEPVNSGQAQPLDVPGLTTLAAEILRFTGGCEEPHRNGEANPHVHLDVTHRWGQRLATLLSSIPEARPAQKHAAWCWLPLDHQGQCEGDQ